jgi:hypothetical protein
MPKHFCHACALRANYINPVEPGLVNPTGSQYLLEKFVRHTAPLDYKGKLSVFNSPDYSSYSDYSVTASLSGCAQIDDLGRTNLVWYAGKHVGITYENGKYSLPNDGIKLVFHDNSLKIHPFSVNIAQEYIKRCQICDTVIFD